MNEQISGKEKSTLHTILLMVTTLAWAVVIWGPWVPARAMALTVLGVDMAEVVKFLPAVRSGQVHVWREAFLLPQVALSVTLALYAWQRGWRLERVWRLAMQVLAVVVALSMLPPAWSPVTLRAPEWRLQVGFIAFCFLFGALSPLWARFPTRWVDIFLALVGTGVVIVVLVQFSRVWPDLQAVYNQRLIPGIGVWATGVAALGSWGMAMTSWRQ